MAQPPAYNRVKDFGADYPDQTDNQAINTELDAVSSSVNGIRANLALIQRDDGGLRDGIVTKDSLAQTLKDELYAEFSGNINDSVLEAQQAAADATNAAEAANADAATATAAKQAAQTASTAAQASASAASASQSAAFTSANAASASATAATGSATSASASASSASAAKTAAEAARDAAIQARDLAVPAATTATTKAAEAAASATSASSSANLAQQWATKVDGPVDGVEFSAKHYAQLAEAGMGLPVYAAGNVPTTNVGPIFVSGQGPMGWDGARYVVTNGEHGQCRFVFVSSTECRLMPRNGNGLVINGRQYRIGAAGVPITTAGAAANGRYFVFAKDDGSGGIALELASTTGASYSVHSDGVTVKTGDPTRTLVGWVGTTAGNTFADSGAGNRFVASWFNRRRLSTSEQITGSTSSTTTVGLGSGRALFNWAGEEVEAKLSGYGVLSTSNYYTMEARRDGVTPAYVPGIAAGRNGGGPASVSSITADTPSEGAAVYQVFGSVSSGSTSLAIRLTCTTNI